MRGKAVLISIALAAGLLSPPPSTAQSPIGTATPRPTRRAAKKKRAKAGRVTPTPTPLPTTRAPEPSPPSGSTAEVVPTATPTPNATATPTPEPPRTGPPFGLRDYTPTPEIHRPPDTLKTPVMFNTPAAG